MANKYLYFAIFPQLQVFENLITLEVTICLSIFFCSSTNLSSLIERNLRTMIWWMWRLLLVYVLHVSQKLKKNVRLCMYLLINWKFYPLFSQWKTNGDLWKDSHRPEKRPEVILKPNPEVTIQTATASIPTLLTRKINSLNK